MTGAYICLHIVFSCHTDVLMNYFASCSLMVEFSFIVVIDRLQQLQLCAYKDLYLLTNEITFLMNISQSHILKKTNVLDVSST